MDSILTQSILQDRKITYVITDRDLRVVEISDGVGLFQDNKYKTILGCPLLKLVPELIGSEAVLADILADKLPRFELAWINFEMLRGQTVYLNLVNLPHRNRAGQITGLIHLAQDVTEMGEVHQQLAQHRNELRLLQDQLVRQNQQLVLANDELQRLSDIKSIFISVAAHELKSPLSSIIGFAEMLLDEVYGPITASQRTPLDIIHQSSNRLGTIINDLLDITRIEAGQIELVLKPTDLVALVTNVVAEFKPQLEAKSQRLILNAQPNLPFALCDQNRTIQIINNLVSNAAKYSYEGELITVNITLADEEEILQVSVADNGVGIPAKDQTKLFSRFFRAGTALLTGAKGTGLGLNITRSLVELQGGRIWFESELKKGSTFYVTFSIAGRPTTT